MERRLGGLPGGSGRSGTSRSRHRGGGGAADGGSVEFPVKRVVNGADRGHHRSGAEGLFVREVAAVARAAVEA